ncbi:DNA polymerase-like [Cornus florida]|uniref:DNA polymerase-like n=1 Tax=Cornus florida TaxID=4283 RepID=UPI002899CD52|nr:DNA polymerase-like [Cornus florida]XP_059646074.1 DNA polymerase-like [Cornus florida]XP_059646384.1 DNA polymerase-like [Cornus florida]XP_059646385.1 DNA polymerase-like [Cornus florida]
MAASKLWIEATMGSPDRYMKFKILSPTQVEEFETAQMLSSYCLVPSVPSYSYNAYKLYCSDSSSSAESSDSSSSDSDEVFDLNQFHENSKAKSDAKAKSDEKIAKEEKKEEEKIADSPVGYYSKEVFYYHLSVLRSVIDRESSSEPYEGLIIAQYDFKEPYLQCSDIDVIALAVMCLLLKYAYSCHFDYAKCTIGYRMKIPTGDVSYTVGSAFSLLDSHGTAAPTFGLYTNILKLIMKKAEDYGKSHLSGLFIRVYLSGKQSKAKDISLTSDLIDDTKLWQLLNDVKSSAGFLVVQPGEDVGAKPAHAFETFYSEDHLLIMSEFKDRSRQMLFSFLGRLAVVARSRKIQRVYFHNLGFDGILLMQYYVSLGNKYTIEPLMRNSRLYELAVYQEGKLLFRLRDSYLLLPSSLATLAETLCPQLGPKGSIPIAPADLQVSHLLPMGPQLLKYMTQDIRLLGGIMASAQEIYWTQYKVDILGCLTLSALAMNIFRISYYDPESWPIHIPSRNEDAFIRRGYYGGHADTYIPYGEDLYYYDVNSLYPFIMKTYDMPGGKPVWHGNLEGRELSTLYGFIEAYVVCPPTIKRPFLPYRDENETLLFPTGKFVGVYYSEELIYARELGYTIVPLRGYLFNKKPSPFEGFVSSIFGKRKEAKKKGDEAMSFGYKILMNSLYGRDSYEYWIKKDNFIFGDRLGDHYYIVNYVSNAANAPDSEWIPPKISAVQLSAAISACSRIHMYKYISREDCYYTDTDSAILGNPLPDEEVSNLELGKLKIEHKVKKGHFLAPKSYSLETEESGDVIRHKGPAKKMVNRGWFEGQFADLARTQNITVESHFRVDWHTLNIAIKKYQVSLGSKIGTKREPVFDENGAWIDTKPKHVIDLGGQESEVLKLELKMLKSEFQKKEIEYQHQIANLSENLSQEKDQNSKIIASLEEELQQLREEMKAKALLTEEKMGSPKSTEPVEPPTFYDQPHKKAKKGQGQTPLAKKPP